MDAPDKLTVKVTFSSKDPMDAEVIPVLREQKKKAGFIRTAVFCYVKGVSPRRDALPPQSPHTAEASEAASQPQHQRAEAKLDSKVSMLDKLDF